ncbi:MULTISPECIES: hypothetical protein [Paenibacillus]|uniref:Cytochrome-c oxidase n=2 Tax=Paenibacillus lactis TaxID=228574 RepID=G4HAN9_9BACL|nr:MULTISPECIES: hypothetical protein [Paenibacillus]EHB66998.1 hypothetical protein PaelaDRAFT_1222 [Paenibacillus lactis 154]MBP1895040.1 hypothetical protein [Paenibacillus lactis]MCM3496806.1 hypothetical protein [Paenibacillus lactis]HAF96731.1 hypothetical protein [Paenibacillus lactis]
MEQKWSLRLIRYAALFGILGTYVGSKMSGEIDYSLRPIHAHILLVGWLSVFAWGIFYRAFKVKYKKLVAVHGWMAILGSFGLTFGMWMYNLNPFELNETLVMILFIVGGSVLLLAFLLFVFITFFTEKEPT